MASLTEIRDCLVEKVLVVKPFDGEYAKPNSCCPPSDITEAQIWETVESLPLDDVTSYLTGKFSVLM